MVIHGEGRERRAACNSLTQGEETGRARGDRAFHQGQKNLRGRRGEQEGRWAEARRKNGMALLQSTSKGRSKTSSSIHPLMRDEDNLMYFHV